MCDPTAHFLMNGHMSLACCTHVQCGNHRYGQLGISERVVKPLVLVCDECATLQAMVECNECPKVCPCFSMHSFATSINDGMMQDFAAAAAVCWAFLGRFARQTPAYTYKDFSARKATCGSDLSD